MILSADSGKERITGGGLWLSVWSLFCGCFLPRCVVSVVGPGCQCGHYSVVVFFFRCVVSVVGPGCQCGHYSVVVSF